MKLAEVLEFDGWLCDACLGVVEDAVRKSWSLKQHKCVKCGELFVMRPGSALGVRGASCPRCAIGVSLVP